MITFGITNPKPKMNNKTLSQRFKGFFKNASRALAIITIPIAAVKKEKSIEYQGPIINNSGP